MMMPTRPTDSAVSTMSSTREGTGAARNWMSCIAAEIIAFNSVKVPGVGTMPRNELSPAKTTE